MPKSAWTGKDQIHNFLKERRLMRSLEKFVGGRLETLSLWFTLIVLSALRRSDNENQLNSYKDGVEIINATCAQQVYDDQHETELYEQEGMENPSIARPISVVAQDNIESVLKF
ncbi:hypothetical protein Tco_1400044 [Tanacetum coccineum]